MFRKRPSLIALLAFICCLTCSASGITDPASGLTAEEQRLQGEARIARADSMGDRAGAIAARLDLAAVSTGSRAYQLIQQAVGLSDTSAVAVALQLRAHRDLVTAFTNMGEMTKANREWLVVERLTNEQHQADLEATRASGSAETVVARAERDSIATASAVEKGLAAAEIEALKARSNELTYIVYGIGGAAVLLLLGMGLFFGRQVRKQAQELKELKQEVTWLRMVSKRAVEQEAKETPVALPVPVAPPIAPAPSIVTPISAEAAALVAAQEDAVLLAMVRKRGIERLTTLREARERGDREKVVRVVHSLKPQLVSLDAPYFTELCTRLVTPGAVENEVQWTADLDRFEQGVARVLGNV